MECGDMKNLSGVLYGRGPTGAPRSHPNGPLATPRSQTASSTYGTPRGASVTYALEAEEFGRQIPPWSAGESERAFSPRTGTRVGRRLIIASRDKESLLEEIIQLKKALAEQSDLMRRKNAHSSRIGWRNRKLEMDVEDLEMSMQLQGPRTGSPSRLRAKLQGLQMTVEELQDTCDAQREELLRLRRDLRVTRVREIEIERDAFAGEMRRLQKVVSRMQQAQNRLSCENRDLSRLRNKYQKLEITNLRLENCITAKAIRPQSQPGTSRRKVQYEQDGLQIHTDQSQSQGINAGQQKLRI